MSLDLVGVVCHPFHTTNPKRFWLSEATSSAPHNTITCSWSCTDIDGHQDHGDIKALGAWNIDICVAEVFPNGVDENVVKVFGLWYCPIQH